MKEKSLSLYVMPTRAELAALYERLVPDPQLRAVGLDLRNRGHVEKVVIGPSGASGRVKGRRGDAGYNVRIDFVRQTSSCGCAAARMRRICEHVAAFFVGVLSLVPEEGTEGARIRARNSLEPDPTVEKFLTELFPGIGPKRAREVAKVFRSVPELLSATERQLRDLPDIGPWAASVLRKWLREYTQLGGGAPNGMKESPPALKVDLNSDPDPRFFAEWSFWAPPPESEEVGPSLPLKGAKFLVQVTKAGPVFFRPENPKDFRVRRALKKLVAQEREHLRASVRRVWAVSDHEHFPRISGRIEALGGVLVPASLVDLPLDGLALYVDPVGRRARFQAVTEGAEEAFPEFLRILEATGSHVYDEVQDLHLILPRDYPAVRQKLQDLGALLIRKKLRGPREITEWKEPSEEEWSPGTPQKRPPPDITPFLNSPPPPGLKPQVKLYGYQKEGVAFIRASHYIAYIGDQPGLGKTLQAIVAALYLPGRILVVCPAGARNVWKKELARTTTVSCAVVKPGNIPRSFVEEMKKAKFVIASYDALLTRSETILSEPYDLVILDEAHYVKNKEAERTKAVHEKLRSIPRRVLLSGTPVMNRPEEVRKQLEFLYPEEWGNERWFRERYVYPLTLGVPEVRKKALQSLRGYLEGIILRRRKADVLGDLPPRHVIIEKVRLSPIWRKEYDEEAALLREHMRSHRDTAFGSDYQTTRGHIMRLRQLASNAKSEHAEVYIRNLLSVPNEKVVVFAFYIQHIETLEKRLAEFHPVVVTGAVSDQERAQAVKKFQEDPSCRVFLGQIIAAGTALTLTAARHVVFVDLDWNPANHEQAGDRVHRIGQTREVFLHYLIASQTVEEDVAKLLDVKSQDTALLLDGDETALGLLARRRQARLVAQLALKAAMEGGGIPAASSPTLEGEAQRRKEEERVPTPKGSAS